MLSVGRIHLSRPLALRLDPADEAGRRALCHNAAQDFHPHSSLGCQVPMIGACWMGPEYYFMQIMSEKAAAANPISF